jgi:nucleoside-diphosphate-sugar epimerase
LRALVTGAAGFVGANLVRRLLADGHEVHALVRAGTDRWRLDEVVGEIQLGEVELRDAESVAAAFAGVGPEVVFHLGTRGAYSWQADAREILETNVLGTSNVVEACVPAGVRVLVNTGSSSEYGRKDHAPAESEALEPNSVYGVAKAAATLLGSVAADLHGLAVTTLRLYSVYGRYEEPGRFVPALVEAALRESLPPLASPNVARDFVWVGDVVDAYLRASSVPDARGVYNVGSGRQTTLAEAVEVARRVFGVTEEPSWSSMPDRSWDTELWLADVAKIERELGWRPTVDFEEGLVRTAAWLRDDGSARKRYAERATR